MCQNHDHAHASLRCARFASVASYHPFPLPPTKNTSFSSLSAPLPSPTDLPFRLLGLLRWLLRRLLHRFRLRFHLQRLRSELLRLRLQLRGHMHRMHRLRGARLAPFGRQRAVGLPGRRAGLVTLVVGLGRAALGGGGRRCPGGDGGGRAGGWSRCR